jgi:hypothetical protein
MRSFTSNQAKLNKQFYPFMLQVQFLTNLSIHHISKLVPKRTNELVYDQIDLN